jgi:hypothetical protein
LDDAIGLLVNDHESDAVLEFLHKCSQELLESNITEISPTAEQSDPKPTNKSIDNKSEQLESIKDLMRFDHLYHKQNSPQISQNSIHNNIEPMSDIIEESMKPLSPISCQSDCGYESAHSPSFTFDENIASNHEIDDMEWQKTLSELFPDLV